MDTKQPWVDKISIIWTCCASLIGIIVLAIAGWLALRKHQGGADQAWDKNSGIPK
jgi:hypothetical protein